LLNKCAGSRSMPRVEYQEFPVPEALRRHIQCVWRLVDDAPRGVQTIYPDGRCELIAQLGGRSRLWDAVDGWHVQAPTLFAAQRVTAVRFEPLGRLDDIGVRLQPAVSNLVTRELAAMRDRVVDLAGLDRGVSRSLDAAARAFVAGKPVALWRLLSRLCEAHRIDTKIEAAVARVIASDGQARIDTIARAAALGVRSLQTRFLAEVGLSPKEFARLLRLQATLRALDGDSALADVATDTGYADQAHATREVKRVTGLTLSRLREGLRRDRDDEETIRIAAAFVRGTSRSR
ncbi:MAG TPA: helix-turn-helix transcriptional regulator, partial [Vicinamibacterales bacterium]|nr:helix-turn-helix transcriptional regulator [Vicinamibacterales bacterium]